MRGRNCTLWAESKIAYYENFNAFQVKFCNLQQKRPKKLRRMNAVKCPKYYVVEPVLIDVRMFCLWLMSVIMSDVFGLRIAPKRFSCSVPHDSLQVELKTLKSFTKMCWTKSSKSNVADKVFDVFKRDFAQNLVSFRIRLTIFWLFMKTNKTASNAWSFVLWSIYARNGSGFYLKRFINAF